MIKGAKTIGQYKILKWIQKTFDYGCVAVKFTGDNTATITDTAGFCMNISYSPEAGITTGEMQRMSEEIR